MTIQTPFCIESLEEFKNARQPLVLTIGNFDGVHRGHRALLSQARSIAGSEGAVIVITFRNHPSEILQPENPISTLCTVDQKIALLKECGVDQVILLPFTRQLAKYSAESFVERVRQFIPFSHLVLGHDAKIGHNRQGNRLEMQELGMEWGFTPYYLNEYRYEGKPVSSTYIREALQKGKLAEVEELLGRPYRF